MVLNHIKRTHRFCLKQTTKAVNPCKMSDGTATRGRRPVLNLIISGYGRNKPKI